MANGVEIPHFNFPFDIWNGHVTEVEQDTTDDIANCVTAIVLTPEDFRTDIDDFGIDDMTFTNHPLPAKSIAQEILNQEPRAAILLDTRPSIVDDLIAEVTLEVAAGGGT